MSYDPKVPPSPPPPSQLPSSPPSALSPSSDASPAADGEGLGAARARRLTAVATAGLRWRRKTIDKKVPPPAATTTDGDLLMASFANEMSTEDAAQATLAGIIGRGNSRHGYGHRRGKSRAAGGVGFDFNQVHEPPSPDGTPSRGLRKERSLSNDSFGSHDVSASNTRIPPRMPRQQSRRKVNTELKGSLTKSVNVGVAQNLIDLIGNTGENESTLGNSDPIETPNLIGALAGGAQSQKTELIGALASGAPLQTTDLIDILGGVNKNKDEQSQDGSQNPASRHKRQMSSWGDGNAVAQLPEIGLSASGERAKLINMAMKKANPATTVTGDVLEDIGDPSEDTAFAEMIDLVETKRDLDDENSSKGSKGGSSRASSTGSRSKGLSSSGTSSRKKNRPLLNISSGFGGGETHVDKLLDAAEVMQDLFAPIEEGENEDDDDEHQSRTSSAVRTDKTFLEFLVQSHPDVQELPSEEVDVELAEPQEFTPMLNPPLQQEPPPNRTITGIANEIRRRTVMQVDGFTDNIKYFYGLINKAHPDGVMSVLIKFLQIQVALYIIPAIALSGYLFYHMDNPKVFFLPSSAGISWWILFGVRQYITFKLATVTEFLIVDVLATRSRFSVRFIGPLATLYLMTAKGWPFVLFSWSAWNFVLLHGTSKFCHHWLFFTGIEMFTVANPSAGVLASSLYKQLLTALMIYGGAVSIKGTVLALYLGKRIYKHYKPKLERLMVDVLLLSEVAELANTLEELEAELAKMVQIETPDAPFTEVNTSLRNSGNLRQSADLRRSTGIAKQPSWRTSTARDIVSSRDMSKQISKELYGSDSDSDDETASEVLENEKDSVTSPSSGFRGDSCGPLESNEGAEKSLSKQREHQSANTIDYGSASAYIGKEASKTEEDGETPLSNFEEPLGSALHQGSTVKIKTLLDAWEEPVNKSDKESDPTIHEVLQFRKALSLLDDTHPFSLAFGPAYTRDLCIKSSKKLYKRLLGFKPGSTVLDFEVIGVLAYDADGNFDEMKAKAYVQAFRPDKFDEVSLLAFVQSCDVVYKNLRYLRASVGNSTAIDGVLESIFNGFFYMVLTFAIMSELQLNPWTLLVSLSTIMVSFAFALGPSVAKIIEGMNMIAIRRPFDLGDRISIDSVTANPGKGGCGYDDTWLVEDCNLFTTTLRLARTNEVCTVNNGTIANARIVNHGRSKKALVTISLLMNLKASHDEVQVVKQAVEQYIQDNPRVWSRLINFKISAVDPNKGMIAYSARLQHVKAWQEYLPILQDQGELEKFCANILMTLNIAYIGANTNNNVFIKEFAPNPFITPDGAAITPKTEVPGTGIQSYESV